VKDWTIAVGERIASLNELAIDLIKEADLNGIGRLRPDREIGSLFGWNGAEIAWVGLKHAG
jgi:hypothetical protein